MFPYKISSLANDFSVDAKDRKPIHLAFIRHDSRYFHAGTGILWYPYLGSTNPSGIMDEHSNGDAGHATVHLVYGEFQREGLMARAEYATFGWDLYPLSGGHEFWKGFHVFSEMGASYGPAKGSLMFAYASGNRVTDEGRHTHFPIDYKVLQPYQSLLFETYGGGNRVLEGPPGQQHGMMSDAYAFGARVDLAVAANLNLWGSALWAHRLEKEGTRFGEYTRFGRAATPAQIHAYAARTGRAMIAAPDNYGYVSDGFLGYEFNFGADWRMTELLDLRLRGAYWKPGARFREAYQGFAESDTPTAADDPPSVVGINGSFVFRF